MKRSILLVDGQLKQAAKRTKESGESTGHSKTTPVLLTSGEHGVW
jgi:hypothetical protein